MPPPTMPLARGRAMAHDVPVSDLDFEGTLVLERLAEVGRVEDFFDLVDADDFGGVERLMRSAGLDTATIALVLRKMRAGDDEP